jgi:predicted HTH transcriptional regulator
MSRYVETFFGKEAKSIEISDLQAFFSDKQYETSTVEFKSGDVEINDVFKEITAFLNTEGGLLIIGAPKETKDQKKMGTNHFFQGNLNY